MTPGTIAGHPESAGPVSLEIVDYTIERVETRTVTRLEDLVPAPAGVNRWVRIQGSPGASLLSQIGGAFGVHNLILEDIASSGQRIKVEEYENLLYAVGKVLKMNDQGEIEESEMSLILTEGTLITVFESTDTGFYAPIMARLSNRSSFLRSHRVDYLFYAIIDLIVDCCFLPMRMLEDRAADLETRILDNPQREELHEVHQFRGATSQMRAALWAMRDMVSRIERAAPGQIDRTTLFYFRDVHDNVMHLIDHVAALRDGAGALMELYMSGVSNRMNEIMKVLTIISTLFIPLTFIAGVYGMNFRFMPELEWRWAYPAVWGIMIASVVAMLAYFRRRKWF